jgi:DNA-binding transcriptional ArsR family regulator
MDGDLLDRGLAETYAGWFRTLSDPSRVQILHLLASAGRPMPVGEIVSKVRIGQSTVSHHLAVLAETRFVLVEKAGTARLYRVNDACISCFPSAADVVMGRTPAAVEEVPSARA